MLHGARSLQVNLPASDCKFVRLIVGERRCPKGWSASDWVRSVRRRRSNDRGCRYLTLAGVWSEGSMLAESRPRTEQGERCLQMQDIDVGLTHDRARASQASALLINVRTT